MTPYHVMPYQPGGLPRYVPQPFVAYGSAGTMAADVWTGLSFKDLVVSILPLAALGVGAAWAERKLNGVPASSASTWGGALGGVLLGIGGMVIGAEIGEPRCRTVGPTKTFEEGIGVAIGDAMCVVAYAAAGMIAGAAVGGASGSYVGRKVKRGR